MEVTSCKPTELSLGKWFSNHSMILVCCCVGDTMKNESLSLLDTSVKENATVVGSLPDKHAVILVATTLILHACSYNSPHWDVHIVAAQILQVSHHRLLVAPDNELGKAGHVNQANALPAHQVLVLYVVEEVGLVEGALFRELGRGIFPMVKRVKIKWSFPTHDFPKDSASCLALAVDGGGANVAAKLKLGDERVVKLVVAANDLFAAFQQEPGNSINFYALSIMAQFVAGIVM